MMQQAVLLPVPNSSLVGMRRQIFDMGATDNLAGLSCLPYQYEQFVNETKMILHTQCYAMAVLARWPLIRVHPNSLYL